MILPSIDCPPWVFDPEKYTDRRLEFIDSVSGQDLRPMVIITYFTVPDGGLKASDFNAAPVQTSSNSPYE